METSAPSVGVNFMPIYTLSVVRSCPKLDRSWDKNQYGENPRKQTSDRRQSQARLE
jgi:hypothetical protein